MRPQSHPANTGKRLPRGGRLHIVGGIMNKVWNSAGLGVLARWPACLTIAVLAAWMVVMAGCSVVTHEATDTKSVIQSLAGKVDKRDPTNALAVLQSEIMRGADLYVGTVAQAADEFRDRVRTADARDAAQQWKLMTATAAYINATDENPLVSVVDMAVLASVSRRVVEDYWVGKRFGEAARPLLEVHRTLETNVWRIMEGVLTPAQTEEVRQILREYEKKYPDLRYVAAARLPELAEKLGKARSEQEQERPGSLFNLLYLNPLAGLDPTTQAIQQTRLLAQRVTYYLERMSMLWSWQAQLALYQVAAQPEAQGVLSNLTEVAQSTKVFAQTAEGLPKLVDDQRQAAINQIFDRLAIERTNLLAELGNEETKVRGLLSEARQTLQSGGQMADSVNAAIKSLDAFVQYVSPPDTNLAPATVDTNSRPFNVLDYGAAASHIGAMATNLTTLIQTVNQSESQAARLGRQATADAKEVIGHAFRLGLVLIVVLLGGLVLAGLAYRCGVSRLTRTTESPPGAK
jgi:hypothetical protein